MLCRYTYKDKVKISVTKLTSQIVGDVPVVALGDLVAALEDLVAVPGDPVDERVHQLMIADLGSVTSLTADV